MIHKNGNTLRAIQIKLLVPHETQRRIPKVPKNSDHTFLLFLRAVDTISRWSTLVTERFTLNTLKALNTFRSSSNLHGSSKTISRWLIIFMLMLILCLFG